MARLQGYLKQEHIVDVGKHLMAQSISTVIFDKTNLHEYKEAFIKMRSEQKILNSTFEEDKWILSAPNLKTTCLGFDLALFPDMKWLLKCFIILGLIEGQDEKYTQFRVKHLNDCIIHCRGFRGTSEDMSDRFEAWLLSKSKQVLSKFGPVIEQFLGFVNLPYKQELLSIADQFCVFTSGIRNLPNFKDILVFDFIVTDFQKTWSAYEKLIFYPIVLWWRITLVIPMRVSEFCALEKDCLSHRSGRFFLKVPRKKIKKRGVSQLDMMDTLEINQDLAHFILEYKEMTSQYSDTPYLLSYDAYCESLRVKKCHHAKDLKRDKDAFTPTQLRPLITYFYDDIVEKKYHYKKLERVNPMDTRHFAFCNMMLQGFNMLTIARIGGHQSIYAQMHYFSHLERLSESSVQYLADQHTFNILQGTLGSEERVLRAKAVLQPLSDHELEGLPAMEYGYCTYNPTQCPVGDCRHCPHLYIHEFDETVIRWLNDESDYLEHRIKEQLELMKRLTCHMKYNFSTFEYDHLAQAELSYLAVHSHKLREQKAHIDTKLHLTQIERKNQDEK